MASEIGPRRPAPVTEEVSCEGVSDLRLRRMRRSDLEAVHKIELASFATPWSERTFRSLMGRRNVLLLVAEGRVATEERRLLGYSVLWFAGEEAELGDLAVHPDARRCGLGRLLLTGVLRGAVRRGARAVFLEVRASNEGARRLYEQSGFRPVGTRQGYYQKPREDALVMRRALP